MNQTPNNNFISKSQSYQPILSKLQIRFPKLKIEHKKYQSPNQSPQRDTQLFKKNSFPSQDETKQQTKMQNSSQTTLQKLLEQLQDHSKKLHNVVYSKTSTSKQEIQNTYSQNRIQNFRNDYCEEYCAKEYQPQISNSCYKKNNSQDYLKSNRIKEISTKYEIKSSKQIVNQWRRQKLISKNLLGVHWQIKFASKFHQIKKKAFQSIKSQFCIQNGILATQSRFQEPIRFQKVLQNVGVGFNKVLTVLKFKALTKLRDAFIKMKFHNDISGVYAKSNETTTSNKNMFTSFFQLSDQQIIKQAKGQDQYSRPILQNKSIINEKSSKISIKELRQEKNKSKNTSNLYQQHSNSGILPKKSQLLLKKQSQIQFHTPKKNTNTNFHQLQYQNFKKNSHYHTNQNNQGQSVYKKLQSNIHAQSINTQKSTNNFDNEYNFRTPIKNINLISTPKKDQMRIYPYTQKKEIHLQQKSFQHSYKNQITSKSQQIQSNKFVSFQNGNIYKHPENCSRIEINYQNKKIIGHSMDQRILQRHSRSMSTQFHLSGEPGGKMEQNIINSPIIRPNVKFSQDSCDFKYMPNQVQYQVNNVKQINKMRFNPFEQKNRKQIEKPQQNIISGFNIKSFDGNRIQRSFSHQYLPLRQQPRPIKTQTKIRQNYFNFNQIQNQISPRQLEKIKLNNQVYQTKIPINLQPSIQSRILPSNHYRLPVIFTNHQSDRINTQNNGRQSRSLSENYFIVPQVLSSHQYQQSKVLFQPQLQNINIQRQRQSSTDSYGRLLKQPYIKQIRPQQKKQIVQQKPVRQINSQYFIGNIQLQNNKNVSVNRPFMRQNSNSFRNRL